MKRYLILILALLSLAACDGRATPTPDVLATEVARAVAATLTAEASAAVPDAVATQVAVARSAAATLTAEAESLAPAAPAATAPPPETPAPGGWDLGPGLRLVMHETQDDGLADHGYHVWAPLMAGTEQPVIEPFNRAVEGFVLYAIDDFRQGVTDGAAGPGSSLWVTHTVTVATDDLVSVLFYADGYVMGAAHPFHYSHSLNYDLSDAEFLDLADLFLPDSDYLEVLSRYSLDELERKGVLEWEDGALPAPENYQRWNITPEGLLVSFDEYSVAPYAAGPQSVVVPYEILRDIARPDGPLAPFLR